AAPARLLRPASSAAFRRERREVLVAASGKADEDSLPWVTCGKLARACERMRAFERRQDALELCAFARGRERIPVPRDAVLDAPDRLQQCMLGTHGRVVEAC